MKRLIAFLLALVLMVSYLPAGATHVHAEEVDETLPVAEQALLEEEVILEEAAEETEPAVEETEPVVEETEHVVEETEPVVEETEPVVEETEPIVEETEPIVEETEPIVEETEPVVEETEPVVEETEPVVEETEPAAEETPVAVKESTIVAVPEAEVKDLLLKTAAQDPKASMKAVPDVTAKTVKETKEIRVRKQLADGTFTWETKKVTVADVMLAQEALNVADSPKNAIVQDEDSSYYYYFETFADLQELAATFAGTDEYIYAFYRGQGPLVISEDMTLPDEITLYVYDHSMDVEYELVIPEGVAFAYTNELYANKLTVNGTLTVANGWMHIYSSLDIAGQVNNAGYIYLYDSAVINGKSNISFDGQYALVQESINATSVAELVNAVAQMKTDDPHWGYKLYWFLEEDTVLDQSVKIPSSVQILLQSSSDDHYTLTIPSGQTLSVAADSDWSIFTPVVVEGTLNSDTPIEVWYPQGGRLTVAKGGSITGKGDLYACSWGELNALSDAIAGVDLSNYIVEDWGDGNWCLANITGREKLPAPTNLTWHKAVNYDDSLIDEVGSFAWELAPAAESVYDIIILKEVNGEFEAFSDTNYYYSRASENSWHSCDDLIYALPESGNYKFVIQGFPVGDAADSYLCSDAVESEVYTYKKPSDKIAKATNLEIVPMEEDGQELFGLRWEAETIKYVLEWYYSEEKTSNILADYTDMTEVWGWNTNKDSSVDSWFTGECGTGYYYARLRVVSDNIEKKTNSDWSAVVGPYYYYDPVGEAIDAIDMAMEEANNANQMRQNLAALDQQMLVDAFQKDKSDQMMELWTYAESLAGGPVAVTAADGFNAFKASEVSVVGANLNTPASADAPITLVVGQAEKTHTLAGDYNSPNAVQFSMHLSNVEKQTVPVVVTLPVPTGINPNAAVVIHYGENGEEILKPIRIGDNCVTVVVSDFSDFVITEDIMTQAEFEAAYLAAREAGTESYVLRQPVVLTENLTLPCDQDEFFRLSLEDGGAITVSAGVTFDIGCYLVVDGVDSALTVAGTLKLNQENWNAEIDVHSGTITVADGGKVDASYIVRKDVPEAKLVGWPLEKTCLVIVSTTMAEIREALALHSKYYYVNISAYSETPLVLTSDLEIPENAALDISYTDVIVSSGVKLINNGQLSFGENTVTVESGAELINNYWTSLWQTTLNLDGAYGGFGDFNSFESTINGKMIQINVTNTQLNAGGIVYLHATMIPESDAELVWTLECDSDQVTLVDEGLDASIYATPAAATQTVTIKVSAKDGSVVNEFEFPVVGGHHYKANVVAPTYTQYGYTEYYCQDEGCDAYYIDYNSLVKPKGLPKPNVKVSNNTKGKPVLSWKHDGEADYYYVYRATSKTGKKTYIGKTTGSSYTDSKATTGKAYYYFVKAICKDDSSLNSSYSTYDKAYCKTAAPSISVSVSSTTGKPTVKWKKVSGAKAYRVYRATSKSGKYKLLKTTKSTSYTDTSAKAGTTYYYKVQTDATKGSSYDSIYSSVKSALCKCAKPVVKIALSSKKPKLSWKAVSGRKYYAIYRSTSKSGKYTKIKTTTATSFRDTTAKKGKTYYYKVVAVNSKSAANSSYSTVVKIKSK